MTEEYHNLSLRLYEILDWIGASEEMRANIREYAIVHEIVLNHISGVMNDDRCTMYMFGSNAEGTTTPGLNSDRDSLYCLNSSVVDNISHSPQNRRSLLMVTDETTHPGYYKLQMVIDKFPVNRFTTIHNNDPSFLEDRMFRPDYYDRMCLEHARFRNDYFGEQNGPAVRSLNKEGYADADIVFAVGCQYIPNCAKSWLRRVVSCDRLNEAQIKRLKEYGCFFVGINHPSSQNGPIEWRISFSLQERELMTSLNSTQHKCYVLLKIIKKDIIQKRVPGSISSYHCKTCVLYAIEKTSNAFWRRGNLLECLRFCIKILLYWVKENCCPNYFIPDENMFDRLQDGSLRQVRDVLEGMLLHWCGFLWSLKCDNIGEVLNVVLFGRGPSIMRVQRGEVSTQSQNMCRNFTAMLKYSMIDLLRRCRSGSADEAVLEFHSIETYFKNTGCVEDYTGKETRLAISYFLPYLRLQIAQCIASIMLVTRNADRLRIMFSKFKYYIEKSKDCDVTSSFLIVASYCIQSERHDICERILLQCETSLKSYVGSLCFCGLQGVYLNEAINEQIRIVRSQHLQYKEYTRTCTAGCLTFLPHQANLVHPALHYEMYRSVNTPAESRRPVLDDWFDWIVVDSKVYMYFLQYVLYSKINKPIYKQDAIDNLIHIMTRVENFGHLETAYNLLGWIFTQENKIQQAMGCFLTSWSIRPIHNAAKWHVLLIISSRNRRY